jgi:hypothetical protein
MIGELTLSSPSFEPLVQRLSRQSVAKHFDAYEDVDWDAPDSHIDPEDPRFILQEDDGLGGTAWYQSQPAGVRARLGLHIGVCQLKVGIEFEQILSRGLLQLASGLREGSPELRYVYHEVIEESQHSLMFQELIHRTGLEPFGMGPLSRWPSELVPTLGRVFPELFFIHVLAGEVPIDLSQRAWLDKRRDIHPLFERVMRIHVLEEARHICFAREFLKDRVPRLGTFRMLRMRIGVPFVLKATAETMLRPPRKIGALYGVPRSVMKAAYVNNANHRRKIVDRLEPIRELCEEIGVLTPALAPLWKVLGIGR